MSRATGDTHDVCWPGMDVGFRDSVRAALSPGDIARIRARITAGLLEVRGKPCNHGMPVRVTEPHGRRIARFARAYHAAIETIVLAWPKDEAVRRALATPGPFHDDIGRDDSPPNSRIHLCRLDLHLDPRGGFQILETNANCPAALMSSGLAGAFWRELISRSGIALPEPLDHERPGWTARWFVESATSATGVVPTFVALFRERGGNRLELPGLAHELARMGIEAMEADPRDVTPTRDAGIAINGTTVQHAFLKLGIQEYAAMRPRIGPFVAAVQQGRTFVQNGLRGRLVGDNKLCLAVLSDPSFEYLFSPETLATIRDHIPWSRGLASCSEADVAAVRRDRSDYVLKRPFDTRGRGVVFGREAATSAEWDGALDRARRERWLAQRFVPTSQLDTHDDGSNARRHDLSVGVINGKLSGAFVRSGRELRLNLAQAGRMHPVFMEL